MIKEFINNYFVYIIIYYILISVYAIIITISDKKKAKNNKWRISENRLMTVGLFGGALAMYITMKNIHHKTKHKKFMIGLPIEIILHILFFVIIIFM